MAETANEISQRMMPARGSDRWRAAEFFAGIGLAGHALSKTGIEVVWSNDISASKHNLFERQFGSPPGHDYVVADLGAIGAADLPRHINLAWASFPCTDLSIAGGRAGLHRGPASSSFWHFVKALQRLGPDRPPVVALENVPAFASSHGGRDIASAIRSLNGLGYSVDVLNIDARHFLPQSRQRLFLVGALDPGQSVAEPSELRPAWLDRIYEDESLVTHKRRLPRLPPAMTSGLHRHVENMGEDDERWWAPDRVTAYVESLSKRQSERFELLMNSPELSYRTAYRRMRARVPRWEMRDDGIAGCLRTSSGGSSKQAVLRLGCKSAKIRWMTPSEYASLMGVPEFYLNDVRPHHAYSAFGDAVCTPVVEWLSSNYLIPLLNEADRDTAESLRGGVVQIAN